MNAKLAAKIPRTRGRWFSRPHIGRAIERVVETGAGHDFEQPRPAEALGDVDADLRAGDRRKNECRNPALLTSR